MLLKDKDFTDEQSYHTGLRKAHNRWAHGPGVLKGLEVKRKAGTDVEAEVEAGYAVLPDGQELMLEENKLLRAPEKAATVFVVLARKEEKELGKVDDKDVPVRVVESASVEQ